ncbi:MAG: hypothetical protein ACLGHG_06415 [Gammaproteobacteria bacterium]
MKRNDTSRIARFRKPGDHDELARLKRLTGLDYETVPVSLVSMADPDTGTSIAGGDGDCPDSRPLRPARR